ncbi:MAG: metal-dependent transcriptional regulator [Actinobacteria bacterium]|nr:metal-dependent transcriptional regulator [Actinomycetota bacterium]
MATHGHSVDDYLETIYFLAFPVGEYGPIVRDAPVQSIRIAEMLSISRPSVSEMMKRLERDGFVARGERKEAILTEKGLAAAERAVRRHRIVECFVTDYLGYSPADAHALTDELGGVSDETVERLAERLGRPERCPHGWPTDPEVERDENRSLQALSEIESGERATVIRITEHDAALLTWFYAEGLVPGATVDVAGRKAGGEVRLVVAGHPCVASAAAAAGVFVLPQPTAVTGGRARSASGFSRGPHADGAPARTV